MANQDRELPNIASSTYASTTMSNLGTANMAVLATPRQMHGNDAWMAKLAIAALEPFKHQHFDIVPPAPAPKAVLPKPDPQKQPQKVKDKMADQPRRLVQVFIADTDQNVPLDKALLYRGEQLFTDLSDQELFFEIDISKMLKKHNEYRITLTDKSVKSKTIHLEPARIRDLTMTVVTIASF